MKFKTLQIACCAIPLLSFSCEKKKVKPVAGSSPAVKPSPAQASDPKIVSRPPGVKSGRGFPPSLEDAFARMRAGAPKIPTMLTAWSDLWSGPFADPLADGAAASRLSAEIAVVRAEAPESLTKLLQSGQSLEGFDRGTLAGVYGLYVGWLNEPETSGHVYILLRKRCDELPQTKGDAILSVINQDALDVLEPPSDLDEEARAGWNQIARGKNPIYRQIGLSLFGRMTSDPSMQAEFLSNYGSESEPTIKEQVLTQIINLPPEKQRAALKQFKNAQEANGDSEFNRKIQENIDKSVE